MPRRTATPVTSPDPGRGQAAEAIARAEASLAHQNSVSAQLDMHVVSAILNAHSNVVEGAEALVRLQHETEAAVQTRSDLDTPAGARDFQRFLIGKLRDIHAVVLDASLDDTSKSALMAAWTALYDSSTDAPSGADDDLDAGGNPLLDSLLTDDPGSLADESYGPAGATDTATPEAVPMAPAIPNLGQLPSLGAPAGFPLPGLAGGNAADPALRDVRDEDATAEPLDTSDQSGDQAAPEDVSADEQDASPGGPTSVTLPDGETVTAASPQLAAVIEAAVAGAPIVEAFQQQGITLPPLGTAVANPIDPLKVAPADIGVFADHYALALGPGNALLDGQIQHIASVDGPTFLGWEHPPTTTAAGSETAKPNAPTPTRPATTPTP